MLDTKYDILYSILWHIRWAFDRQVYIDAHIYIYNTENLCIEHYNTSIVEYIVILYIYCQRLFYAHVHIGIMPLRKTTGVVKNSGIFCSLLD